MAGSPRENVENVRELWEEISLDASEARGDIVTFFEFVMREQTTRVPLKCAPHQRVGLRFMLDHRRSANLWPVGHTKCVHGDTEVVDPDTGDVLTIRELVADKKRKAVWSWSEGKGVHAAPITAKHALGTKRCLKVTLRSGRSIITTPEHPYLAPTGWIRAGELGFGTTVASVMFKSRKTDPTLKNDIFWDEVVSVEDAGEHEVFDLTVASTSCFVANDIIAHNTYSTEAISLFILGQDVTLRGAIVSASEAQAVKPLKVVSDYVKFSGELRLVFPHLRPSKRRGDLWTQTAITVERPPGIPDPTLVAFGLDTERVLGARLNWVLLDDLLNPENTRTKEARDKTMRDLDMKILSRLDPRTGRVLFTNTAFHLEDAIHMVEKLGWATLRMDILGNIKVQDDATRIANGEEPWNHPELRPASPSPHEECYRLRSHDPDPRNEKPLWFERFYYDQPASTEPGKRVFTSAKTEPEAVAMANAYIDDLRTNTLPHVFAQMYMNECRDDATAMCKSEWVEGCKAKARERQVFTLASEYQGSNPTFTGIDLAFSKGSHADNSALFTFEALPDGHRRILNVDFGQWDGPELALRAIDTQRRYKSVLRVEDNAGQKMLIQFVKAQNMSIPIKAHRTSKKNKWSPEFGVQSVFLDMYNGSWLIPNDRAGRCHPAVQKWIDECLYFVPTAHSGDILMASWFAREQAREWGALIKNDKALQNMNGTSMTASIMAR